MTDTKSLNDKLIEIQKILKVPKDLWNDFSKYNYRSAESIEEKAKPLCHERELALVTTDEPVAVGEWNYIKATAYITDGKEKIAVTAAAREQETKKGMDAAQISGAASSYARKYALAGLFALDDSKGDPDSSDNRKADNKVANNAQKLQIKNELAKIGVSIEASAGYLIEQYGVETPLSFEAAEFVLGELKGETAPSY